MSLQLSEILQQLNQCDGNATNPTLPFLELYDQAMQIAKQIEEADELGFISPAQIAPHFDQLLYQAFKNQPIEDNSLLKPIESQIDKMKSNPTSTTSDDKHQVINETLLAVLNRTRIEYAQTKSSYFRKEKKQWRQNYMESFHQCFAKPEVMVEAFNNHQIFSKDQEPNFNNFQVEELCGLLAAIEAKKDKEQIYHYANSTYQLSDPRYGNTLTSAGFTTPEINAFNKKDKLCYETAIWGTNPSLNKGKKGMEGLAEMLSLYKTQADKDDDARESIMNDQAMFQAQLKQRTKPYIQYKQAREALIATMAQPNTNVTLKKIAQDILDETDALKYATPISLYQLTNMLKVVNKTIKKPSFEHTLICLKQSKEIAQHPLWRKTSNALLILAGVTSILTSIAVALCSFGALSPVSLLGIYLGASLITGGIAIATGIIGTTTLTIGSKRIKTDSPKNKLYKSLTLFAEQIQKTAPDTPPEQSPTDSFTKD